MLIVLGVALAVLILFAVQRSLAGHVTSRRSDSNGSTPMYYVAVSSGHDRESRDDPGNDSHGHGDGVGSDGGDSGGGGGDGGGGDGGGGE